MSVPDYLRDDEANWAEAILAPIDRLVADGVSPNAAFREVAGGLPGGDHDRLRLYWEVSRGTAFGESVKAASFAATYRGAA